MLSSRGHSLPGPQLVLCDVNITAFFRALPRNAIHVSGHLGVRRPMLLDRDNSLVRSSAPRLCVVRHALGTEKRTARFAEVRGLGPFCTRAVDEITGGWYRYLRSAICPMYFALVLGRAFILGLHLSPKMSASASGARHDSLTPRPTWEPVCDRSQLDTFQWHL